MVSLSCSEKRGSQELMVIMKVCTQPMIFRLITIFAMCSVSRPLESPKPGVSMTINFSLLMFPQAWVTRPLTSAVSDWRFCDALKYFCPTKEFAVDDLPWPVTPIRQIEQNLFARDQLFLQFILSSFTSGFVTYKILLRS